MNLFFPFKTERVPVANQQCGLHSGLTVICLFIQDNKGSLWKIPLGGDLMHTANIVVMYHFQSISESDCRSDVPHAVGSNLKKKTFLWIHFTLITNLDVLLLWTSFSPFLAVLHLLTAGETLFALILRTKVMRLQVKATYIIVIIMNLYG